MKIEFFGEKLSPFGNCVEDNSKLDSVVNKNHIKAHKNGEFLLAFLTTAVIFHSKAKKKNCFEASQKGDCKHKRATTLCGCLQK